MDYMTFLIKPASSLCDLRCKYCFYANVSDLRDVKNYGFMTDETMENLIIKAYASVKKGVTFAFQGGEPTLCGVNFFEKFVTLTKKHNTSFIPTSFAIQTNGMHLGDEFCSFFKSNNFLVGISLDGSKDFHDFNRVDAQSKGTFTRVQKAIDTLKKHGVDFNILSVVTDQNARNIGKIYNYFMKEGYSYMQFIPAIDDFDGEEVKLSEKRFEHFLKTLFDLYFKDLTSGKFVSIRQFDNYISILRTGHGESCASNGTCGIAMVVEGDGRTYPCDFYCTDEWDLGNINEKTLEQLLNQEKTKQFIEESTHNENCKACPHFFLCRGGCKRDRVEGYTVHKHCSAYKNFFDYAGERILFLAKTL